MASSQIFPLQSDVNTKHVKVSKIYQQHLRIYVSFRNDDSMEENTMSFWNFV